MADTSPICARCIKDGEAALASVPSRVEGMQLLLDSKFSYTSLKDVESGFKLLLAKSDFNATENVEMSALMSTVRDELSQSLNVLLALKQWIRVQIPQIEDGNNFGVSVQLDVAKGIDELTGPVGKSLDELPGYFESRASAWEKISRKASKENKTSSSTSNETGSKDGDSSKTANSTSTEEKVTDPPIVPDSRLHLVALDVKWFTTFHRAVLGARNAMVLAGDMIEKNMEKMVRPKGTNTQGGGMYSF